MSLDYKPCPECNARLYPSATRCRCGWKERPAAAHQDRPAAVHVDCAHAGCGSGATVRIKTATGWANLCPWHYDRHFLARAEATCARLRLSTPGEKRAWYRQAARILGRKLTPAYQREPGEDEDFSFSGVSNARNVNGALTEGGAIEPEGGGMPPPYVDDGIEGVAGR